MVTKCLFSIFEEMYIARKIEMTLLWLCVASVHDDICSRFLSSVTLENLEVPNESPGNTFRLGHTPPASLVCSGESSGQIPAPPGPARSAPPPHSPSLRLIPEAKRRLFTAHSEALKVRGMRVASGGCYGCASRPRLMTSRTIPILGGPPPELPSHMRCLSSVI